MQIVLDEKDRLLITYETDFEEAFISKLSGKIFRVKDSTGVSVGDFNGVVLEEVENPSQKAGKSV